MFRGEQMPGGIFHEKKSVRCNIVVENGFLYVAVMYSHARICE